MPIVTKRKKVRLPFFAFQIPVGWEAKPLTPAQKKARKAARAKARAAAAKEAQAAVQEHDRAARAAKQPSATTAQPVSRSTVGAAGYGPAKSRGAKTAPVGQLCGQPLKRGGGTCKRVVATKPCPDHPAGKPKGQP